MTIGEAVFTDSATLTVAGGQLDCTLNLDLSHTIEGIILNFQVGSPEPVMWRVWALVGPTFFPLLNVQLPAIEPPLNPSFTIPVFNFGTIGFITTLSTPTEGIVCSAWETVNTGPVIGSAVSGQELRGLFAASND